VVFGAEASPVRIPIVEKANPKLIMTPISPLIQLIINKSKISN
jgi:hypothetical protein